MIESEWNSGPPPSCGWWPASVAKDPTALRWWDGRRWSRVAWPEFDADTAAGKARCKANTKARIFWMRRPASWPARSRT